MLGLSVMVFAEVDRLELGRSHEVRTPSASATRHTVFALYDRGCYL